MWFLCTVMKQACLVQALYDRDSYSSRTNLLSKRWLWEQMLRQGSNRSAFQLLNQNQFLLLDSIFHHSNLNHRQRFVKLEQTLNIIRKKWVILSDTNGIMVQLKSLLIKGTPNRQKIVNKTELKMRQMCHQRLSSPFATNFARHVTMNSNIPDIV